MESVEALLHRVRVAFLVWIALTGLAQAGRLEAQLPAARSFTAIEQVITGFSADQHLYVQGELGVGPQQLADLEEWLDRNGPHWTVVLMKTAVGQVYFAADGRQFFGMDAVEFALGHGLSNRTPFGTLEHPRTGETDAAVFVLYLEERKFSYFASDAQDRRGIGESAWIGELDREARSAMQNGGRIVDAVKNTVTLINNRLNQALELEARQAEERKEAARRAEQERERAAGQTLLRISETRSDLLPGIEELADRFRRDFPSAADSALGKPELEQWRLQLDELAKGLEPSNAREREQRLAALLDQIYRWRDLQTAHRTFSQSVEPLRKRWENMTFHAEGAVADAFSQEAERLMELAQQQHGQGNPEFAASLAKAAGQIEQGEAAVFAAVQATEQQAGQKRAARQALWTGGSVFAGIGVLIGGLLNWRRRPRLKEAFQAYDRCAAAIEREKAEIDLALQRQQSVTGPLPQFRSRGYRGKTIELAEQIDRDCLSLQRMETEARRVLAAAEALLEPSNPAAIAANLISPSRYLAALALLGGKSLNAAVVAEAGSPVAERWLAWDAFADQLANLRTRALNNLDRLAGDLARAEPALQQLEARLNRWTSEIQWLEDESLEDGHLAVPSLESAVLPELRKRIGEIRQQISSDPVSTLAEAVPATERILGDGESVSRILKDARERILPELDQLAIQLRDGKHRIQWIGEEVRRWNATADGISAAIPGTDSAAVARELETTIADFVVSVREVGAIARSIPAELLPQLADLRGRLERARKEVAGSLGIAESRALREAERNPEEHLDAAESRVSVARTAVDAGNLRAAEAAVRSWREETATAADRIAGSLSALQEFPQQHPRSENHLQKANTTVAVVRELVESAARRFLPNALRLRSGALPDHPDGDIPTAELVETPESATSRLATSVARIESAAEGIRNAPALFRSGQVLQASESLQQAGEQLTEAELFLDQAAAHCRLLDQSVGQNHRSVATLMEQWSGLQASIDDPRCENATRELSVALGKLLREWQARLAADRGAFDPFADAAGIHQAQQQLDHLRVQVEGDFAAHAQARLAIEGARQELESVRRLVDRSARDQVPDSGTIDKCAADAGRLAGRFDEIARLLSVAHQDWQPVQQAAAGLQADLGIVAGLLVRELQLAEQAAADFRDASAGVFRAARWSGSLGIRIRGEPGSQQLEMARQSLAAGDYPAAISHCQEALRLAVEAVRAAEQAVEVKRREIAAAAERERRRSRIQIGSLGSLGGSSSRGFSFGSGRSSGGFSSGSSSRSSGGGSGFSRSGW